MRRRVLLLTILFFAIHFGASTYFVLRWTEVANVHVPIEASYAPSFGVAATTFPLYSILGEKIGFFALALINSAMLAVIAALVVVFLSWRTVLTIAIAIPVLFIGAMYIASILIERHVARGFQELGAHATAGRPPADNASAKRVDQLAIRLKAETSERSALNDYFRREIELASDEVDEPPQDVDHFLAAHRFDLNELEKQLLTDEAPRWSSSHEVLPYFTLQKIMTTDALLNRSWERLDAAQRLSGAVLREPDIAAVFVAVAATENQLGVARKLDPPAEFPIRRFDPYQSAVDALAAETATHSRIVVPWYARPYERLAAAETANGDLESARAIRNLRGCRFTAEETNTPQRVPFNPMGIFNAGARIAVRANRMLLDYEGTEKILAAKRGDMSAVASSVCAGHTWTVSGDLVRLQPDVPTTAPALPAHHALHTR